MSARRYGNYPSLSRDATILELVPMKTVTGRVISAEPISLSKAATLLSVFASSENGATQTVSAYLRRASAAFTELKTIHREIKSSTKSKSDIKHEHNLPGEFDELGRAKAVDAYGGMISSRKSETVSEEESINEKNKKKKKSKKKKEEDVADEQQRNEERKEEKKKKKKKRKTDGEMGSEERKSKKKRKSKEIDV